MIVILDQRRPIRYLACYLFRQYVADIYLQTQNRKRIYKTLLINCIYYTKIHINE